MTVILKMHEWFGGTGAARKAGENNGYDIRSLDYVDFDLNPVKAYNALFQNVYKPTNIVGHTLQADILVHGSPCQDNSRIGKRKGAVKGSGTRSALMWETLRIIGELGLYKPRVVVWENVPGIMDKAHRAPFEEYLSDMKALGYTNSYKVLTPMDYGLAQERPRIFVVSILGNEVFDFSKLRQTPAPHISEFLEDDVTDERYMVNVPSMLNRLEDLATPEEIEANKSKFRYIKTIDTHCTTITTRMDRCPNPGVIKLSDGRYRYLTEREAWRLMGFSDEDFDKVAAQFPSLPGKRNSRLYKIAGNSIAVPILEAILELLQSGNYATDLIADTTGQLQLIC